MKKNPTIVLEDVSKSFALNRKNSLKWRLSHIGSSQNRPVEIIKNVSFEVHKGEIVGLIGPNGSGKSTILRLIATIFRPDSGTISTKGTIAPVIELGSGLHPELTGKENILLYASILGMSKQFISDHMDEIVSFSELSEFIDVPVKKYSSGMKTRLAFSVAIFSEVDILLFDEVFAVGDASFRDKSIRKLLQMKSSRSILLTSHDLGLMLKVCDRILILDNGALVNEQSEATIAFIDQMPEGKTFIAEASSNSMYPLIKTGDTITAKKVPFTAIKPDDIILFHLPNLPQIIVHRIIDILYDHKKRVCITKGDNAYGMDSWKISSSEYLGKVIKIGNKSV